jgi:hypothetical protein
VLVSLHLIVGSLLVIVGSIYAVVSFRQVFTGTGFWLRQPKIPPTLDQARAGGWIGVAVAAIAILIGVGQLWPTASAFVATASLLALGIGGVWGVWHRWLRTHSEVVARPK